MAKAKLGIVSSIKNIKSNFSKLPSEAKTSYYVMGGALIIIFIFLIKFFVPKEEQPLVLPNTNTQQKSRGGSSRIDEDTEIPNQLASEIIENRREIQKNSSVIFSRYEETNQKLEAKKDHFLSSLEVELTPVPTNDAIVANVEGSQRQAEQPSSTISDVVEAPIEPPEELYLGVIKTEGSEEVSEKRAGEQVKAILRDPEIISAWIDIIGEKDSSLVVVNPQMGSTIRFAEAKKIEKDKESESSNLFESDAADEGTSPQEAEINDYNGDDFQPGRMILARIDGLIESDTATPFIRLRPVEGPKEWVEDAIFLAQPELIEGQGYQIMIKSVTHKNNSGNFTGVAVTPDEKRSAIIVDDIESRELQRVGLLIGGGLLSGLNTLASRVGTTVTTQTGSVSNVEINGETLAVSAFGGVGKRGEGYLYQKLSETKDNHIIAQNRLVGIMVIDKPKMNWLPELDNNTVY